MTTPDNQADPLPKKMEFSASIEALENRAKKCRRTMLMIGALIVVTTQVMVMMIFYQYQGAELQLKFDSFSISSALERRGSQLADQLISIEQDSAGDASAQLQETIKMLGELKSQDKPNVSISNGFAGSLSTLAFSFGAVAFVILIIQIAVQFMRYYARLSELYNAQADALRVSNGDPEIAFKFMEHFSPAGVELGKTPTTVYEKALDAISSVAKK